MGSAKSKIANSNIFVQNVGKNTPKPIADHTQLLQPKGPLLLLKQQNNSDIVTPIIPGVLQYLLLGYDINIKVQDVSDCPKISYQPYRTLS